MNKVFKVIWNRTKGCYEVVSELAKNHGKASGHYGSSKIQHSSAAIVAAFCLSMGIAVLSVPTTQAAVTIGNWGGSWNGTANTSGTYAIAIGDSSYASSTNGNTQGALAIGPDARAVGNQTVALGAATRALYQQSTAIGNDSMSTAIGAIVLGGDDTFQQYGFTDSASIYGIYRTDKDVDTKYRASISSGVGAVTVGVHGQAISNGSTAIGVMSTAGDGGSRISIDSSASADAIANALYNYRTINTEATAIGAYSHAQSMRSTAIGYRAQALNSFATAIGNTAVATGANATVIGNGSTANGNNAVAIGTGTTVTSTNGATPAFAIGNASTVTAEQSVAVGGSNTVTGTSLTSVNVLGSSNTVSASNVSVVGNSNTVSSPNASVIGNNNSVGTNINNVSIIGNNVSAGLANSVYLGNDSAAIGTSTISQGADNTYTSATVAGKNLTFAGGNTVTGVVTVGSTTQTRRIQGVAPGLLSPTSTDAVNGSQLYSAITTFATHDYSVNSTNTGTDTNYNNTGATGSNALAAGVSAVGKGTNATAVGNASKAYSNSTIAIGDNAVAGNQYDTTSGVNSIAIGINSQTTGTNAISLGSAAKALSEAAIVIGQGASTTNGAGINNIVIGTNGAVASGANNIVMGTGAKTQSNTGSLVAIGTGATIGVGARTNSIAIGTNSKVDGGGVAIGDTATISSSSSQNGGNVAIGDRSSVDATEGGVAIGRDAKVTNSTSTGGGIAIGESATSSGIQSIAMGYNATASNSQLGQIAIGSGANTTGDKSIAIGYGASTSGNQTGQLALGVSASVTAANGVALGSGSVASRNSWDAAATNVYVPTGADSTAVNATKATQNYGAVSVGSSGTTTINRQIINVAAGSADTDAVNVAQLKAVTSLITSTGGQNFTVGADSSHSATGVNITSTANRFDVVGANNNANITTKVATDGKGIQVDLSDSVKSTLSQVATNTTNIQNVNNAVQTINNTIQGAGAFGLSADDKNSVTSALGGTIAVVGDGTNISTSVVDNQVKVSLDRNIDADSLNTEGVLSNGSYASTYIDKTGASFSEISASGDTMKGMSNTSDGSTVYTLVTEAPTVTSETATDGSSLTVTTYKGISNLNESTSTSLAISGTTQTDVEKTSESGEVISSQTIIDTKRTELTNDGIVIKTLHGEQTDGVGGNLDNPTTTVVSLTSSGLDNGGNRIINVGNAVELTDAVNLGQLNEARTHYYSVNATNQDAGSNYDNTGATGDNALAAGVSASATAEDSVAVGPKATAGGNDSVAVGDNSLATAASTTALGAGSQATGAGATALGAGAKSLNTSTLLSVRRQRMM